MRTPHHAIIPAVLALACWATLSPSQAADPSLELCKKLQTERESLEGQGIKQDLAKGPQWAKANLPANRLTLIARYLLVYEQTEFRCENVFAAADAAQAEKIAQEEARVKALANIPPPPDRRPEIVFTSTKYGLIRIPPLPVRPNP